VRRRPGEIALDFVTRPPAFQASISLCSRRSSLISQYTAWPSPKLSHLLLGGDVVFGSERGRKDAHLPGRSVGVRLFDRLSLVEAEARGALCILVANA
jgi:hypothetical protein